MVERPASVVKELVENSLDAGAANIVIEVENGGINLVKVIDDGSGMNREDAEMSLLQHATSKIASQEDLFNIGTLGFRGEALASISSVSEFCLITKDKASVSGTCVKIEQGKLAVSETGAADGTSVEVRNIFYNVPARQKYLKTPVTEFNHIVDLFLNYCLGFPRISWKLIHNGKIIYHFPASDSFQRISDLLGDEIGSNLLKVDISLNGITVRGYAGRPQVARNNRKLQYLFINGRPVSEYIVAKQVKEAYGTLLARDMYPVFILDLIIDGDKIDVNVHPRKLEVRFSEPQLVYRTVYQAVAGILDENDLGRQVAATEVKKFVPIKQILQTKQEQIPVRKITGENQTLAGSGQRAGVKTNEFQKAALDFNQYLSRQGDQSIVADTEPLPKEKMADDTFIPEFKVLGQVENSYIVVETAEAIKVYDQHASSERVQYEKLKREWQIGKLASQKMLIPQNIELSPAEARLANDNFSLFDRLGFEIANFGANNFAISAVPMVLSKLELKQIVLQILGEVGEAVMVDDRISQPVEAILKMMACKSAIKFGDELSQEGMAALVNDLERWENKYTCVHGRPAVLEFKFTELKKMFKRI